MVFGKNIKAVLFDFDGTLFHLAITWQDLKNRLTDHGVADINHIESLTVDNRQTVLEIIREAEAEGISKGAPAPEALDVLNRLQESYKLALVSRNLRSTLQEGLKKIGYTDEMVIVGREDVQNVKPDPRGFQYALEKMGINGDQAVIVGDTNHDVQAGKALGVPVYVVYNPNLEFQPDGAEKYIATLSDLIDN